MGPYEREFHELLTQIAAGSQEAARKFFDQYGPYILQVVRSRLNRRLRTKFDSQDFMQDVWASFFHHTPPPDMFSSREALLAYLGNMASNKVVETVRRRLHGKRYCTYRENSLDGSARLEAENVRDPDPTPSEIVGAKEAWRQIVRLQQPMHKKMLALLRMGYTHSEITEMLKLGSKRVQRLLQHLKGTLNES